MTFEDIEERGLLIYKYIRGSQVYGTNNKDSDIDEGGVYISPNEYLLGLGYDYQPEISDAKHDKTWYELGRFLELALKSNPTILEALFIPEDKVLYEHPIMTEIKRHRDSFLTKKCFMPFGGYAVSQIKKAQGQDKKIHWDIVKMQRKTPIDYVYTFNRQGSQNIQEWLDERGLEQRNIGLVNVPNMKNIYGAYYDFGQHIQLNNITQEYFCNLDNYHKDKFIHYCYLNLSDDWMREEMPYNWVMDKIYAQYSTPIGGYCGIISDKENSNELRCNSHVTFSSVKKGEKPICWISYNEDGYKTHCKKYKEYEDWKKNRNKARYENNLEGKDKEDTSKFYDAKNMYHCFRLIAMATEIARGEGMKLCRTGIDANFLFNVRNRKYQYEDLMAMLKLKKKLMDEAISVSTIPDEINVEFVNNMLIRARKDFVFLQ